MIEPQHEYARRLIKYEKLKKTPNAATLELELCKRDILHFCNNWATTYDPRVEPKHFPFSLYEYQTQTLTWLDERFTKRENGLIEKSRDMGCTWLVCVWAVHKWLFETGFTCLFGSRKEDLVDNHMLDSIFGKLRYIIYRLPKFMRPEITERSKTDRYLTLVNPLNGNEIVGESANIGFGRGGRSSICFIDEFAHVDHSEAIWASVSENSDCIVALSTPNGKDNQFAWLKHETDISVKSLHWSLHPHKDKDWYEKKKAQMKPWQVAQELDLSYERSLEGRVYSTFDRSIHVAKEPIACNPDYEQFVTWDFGIADPTAILWGQITTEGVIQIWQCYELSGWDIDFFIPIAKGFRPKEFELLSAENKAALTKILKKVPQGHRADHYGDHAGTARTANSVRSCRDALKEANLNFKSSGKQTFDWRIECTESLLKLRYNNSTDSWYSIFEVSPDCERFIECLFNYVYDSDDVTDNKLRPKHNWASHMVTALEFFTISRFPVVKKLQMARGQQFR